MSDVEVIKTFMGWTSPYWQCHSLTLNECHEVEARLTDEQWYQYRENLLGFVVLARINFDDCKEMIYASVEQKVKALAAVLRSLVDIKGGR